MKSNLVPYLNFNGNTKEAMEFYHSILGGKLEMQTFGEAGGPVEDQYKDKIMHAELKTDIGFSLMASEGEPGNPTNFGDNISLSLVGDNDEELSGWFNQLADGGKINIPLEKQMWGDKFGMLTDKFGVQWMINISGGEHKHD